MKKLEQSQMLFLIQERLLLQQVHLLKAKKLVSVSAISGQKLYLILK